MAKPYKVLVVEDEELAADRVEMLIDKLGYYCLSVVDNSTDALEVLKQEVPDLVLMDINIQGAYDGIELADLIHAQYPIPIIFVTSLHDEQTFQRIARTNPLAYIIKPFSDIQLQRTIELVFKQQSAPIAPSIEEVQVDINPSLEDHFFIKKGKMLEKILRSDILYLEADGRYTVVHLAQQKFLIRTPLKDLHQMLGMQDFIPVHRSYIVSKNKIDRVNLEDYVIEIGSHKVPLSRREKEGILAQIKFI